MKNGVEIKKWGKLTEKQSKKSRIKEEDQQGKTSISGRLRI